MSLDKAIKHGKEHRKPYRKKYCGRLYRYRNRMHKHKRRIPAPDGKGEVLHGPYEGYFGDIGDNSPELNVYLIGG